VPDKVSVEVVDVDEVLAVTFAVAVQVAAVVPARAHVSCPVIVTAIPERTVERSTLPAYIDAPEVTVMT
jgi:hypothetical protein